MLLLFRSRVITISLPCYYYFAPVLILFHSCVLTISATVLLLFCSRVITISLPCSYYFCSLVSTISAPVLLVFPLLCTSLYYFRFTFVAISTACYYYFCSPVVTVPSSIFAWFSSIVHYCPVLFNDFMFSRIVCVSNKFSVFMFVSLQKNNVAKFYSFMDEWGQ